MMASREERAGQKRVLILTSDTGYGHRAAAEAVATALVSRYGERVDVRVDNPLANEQLPAILRETESDYDRLMQEMPELYQAGYEASDGAVVSSLLESGLVVALFNVMRDAIRQHAPDVLLTPFPTFQAPIGAVDSLAEGHIPLVTVVTDLVTVHHIWFSQVADLCVVPTEKAHDLAIEYGLPAERVKLVGIPVDPRFADEDRSAETIQASLGWRTDLTTLLVVGSKRVRGLIDVLRAIDHARFPIQLILVAGGDDELYRRLDGMAWHTPAHVYNFVEQMPAFMHASDGIVCKAGGLIVSEALACGLPLLLIDVLPGQEVGNAEYVVEGKAGDLAQDPVEALQKLHHWLDREGALLEQRAQAARRIGRPRAAYEIADLVWEAAGGSGE